MKRRVLSIAVTLAMVLTLLPGAARAADTTTVGNNIKTLLGSSVEETGEGKYELTREPAAITTYIQVSSGDVELDLKGFSITRTNIQGTGGATMFYVTGGSLTIKDTENKGKISNTNGSNGAVILVSGDGKATLGSGITVEGVPSADGKNHSAVLVQNGATLIIDGATISNKNKHSSAVTVGQGSKLTVNSGTIESDDNFGIATNGLQSEQEITINGGTITGGKNAAGIYLPSGKMTVSGESTKITGGAGIVVRGGTLEMNGGTVEATGEGLIEVGDAKTKVRPAAVAIDKNMGYQGGTVKVTITGGTFSSQNSTTIAYSEGNPAEGVKPDPNKDDKVEITGGTFYIKSDEGTKPDESVNDYLDGGLKVSQTGEIKSCYTVKIDEKITGGTVESDEDKAAEGDTVTLTVKPDEGYELESRPTVTYKAGEEEKVVTVEEVAGSGNKYTFTMPASDVTVTAKFVEAPSTVPVTGVTLNKTTLPLKVGETEKLIATVEPDDATNKDVTWSSSDTTVATVSQDGTVSAVAAGEATITVTTKDGEKTATCTVTVTAAETPPAAATYKIETSVSPKDSGTVTTKPEKEAKKGDTVTVTATPKSGYVLDKLTVTDAAGKSIDIAKDNTFEMPAGAVTVTATFKTQSTSDPGTDTPGTDTPGTDTPDDTKETYRITAYASPYAGGYVIGSGTYDKGASVTVRAIPYSGYRFVCWLESGVIEAVSTSTVYTFTAAANKVLTAVFEPVNSSSSGASGSSDSSGNISYRVVVPVVSNGSATVSSHSVKAGETVTVIAMPDSGYAAAGVSVTNRSGGSVSVRDVGDNVYTFTMPASRVTVNLSFTAARTSAPSTSAPSKMPGSPSVSTASSFTDVPADYAAAVVWAVGRGITAGTGNGTFSPNDPCTRGQILTFIWRAEGMPEPLGANPFADIKPGDYYYKAAMWAYEQGMVSGRTFDADTPCTRSEAVTYLWQLAWQTGSAPTSSSTATAFSDVPAFGYASRAIPWAVGRGITTGTSATTFSPEAVCTRGQIVTFLYRFDML